MSPVCHSTGGTSQCRSRKFSRRLSKMQDVWNQSSTECLQRAPLEAWPCNVACDQSGQPLRSSSVVSESILFSVASTESVRISHYLLCLFWNFFGKESSLDFKSPTWRQQRLVSQHGGHEVSKTSYRALSFTRYPICLAKSVCYIVG